MKPCGHQVALLPDPYNPARPYCRACFLYETDTAYRALWDGAATEPAPSNRIALPCVHLGRVLDRRDCNCPLEHVHHCEVLGSCTLRVCLTCAHYEAV
jgi:hypothetical protein